jgi:hypothetical protein
MKSKIVMPAIYQFEIPDHPQESKWGWHKVSELVEAIPNIFLNQGKCEIAKDTSLISKWLDNYWPRGYFLCMDDNGKICNWMIYSEDWFAALARWGECFIPAKIGMNLINAAKRPFWTSTKTFLRETVR